MKNFPVIDKETGREHWISRSIAVLTAVFAKDKDGDDCVLVVQRGEGTPDVEYIGAYCMPCGYLDYDETCAQAAQRELMEETGINLPISDFKLISINDDPKSDKRQNVTMRYVVKSPLTVEELSLLFTTKNSEKDEVSSIRFVKVSNVNLYEWAFNHQELVIKLYYTAIK